MNANMSVGNRLQTYHGQLVIAATALVLGLHLRAQAGGVVTNCTEAALRAAMVGGGTVTFVCDGTVMPTIAISLSGATNLTFVGSGNANQSCRLLSSLDLKSWVPIATNQIGSDGTVLFYDTCTLGSACRFYRLVMP